MDGVLQGNLTRREHRRLALALRVVQARGAQESLLARYPELTTADACAIRDELLALRLADGERLAGAIVSLDCGDEPRLEWLTDGLLAAAPIAGVERLAVRVDVALDELSSTERVLEFALDVRHCVTPAVAAADPVDLIAGNRRVQPVWIGAPAPLDALGALAEPVAWLARACADHPSLDSGGFVLVSPPCTGAEKTAAGSRRGDAG